MRIEIFFEEIKAFPLRKRYLESKIKNLLNGEGFKGGEISLVFCSDEYLLKMNKRYLNHDYYTDIITFDYVDGSLISGDLFISYDRLRENSRKENVTLESELYRVVFHGILHLIGYNDKSDAEKELMTKKENEYLGDLELEN